MAYAQCLIENNVALLEGTVRPNLVEKFSKVASSSNDAVSDITTSLHVKLQE